MQYTPESRLKVPEQTDIPDITQLNQNWFEIDKQLGGLKIAKVDKVEGLGLSTNDFTTILKEKLDGIESGANYYTPDYATIEEARAGLNNTKLMTPKLTKEAILSLAGDGVGGVTNNVFIRSMVKDKFIATTPTTTFTIPSMNTTKEVILYHKNLILVEGEDFAIVKSSGVVTLNFTLEVNEIIFYTIFETSYDYRDLINSPIGELSSLNTTDKSSIVSAINETLLTAKTKATTTKDGIMSKEDKIKIDGLNNDYFNKRVGVVSDFNTCLTEGQYSFGAESPLPNSPVTSGAQYGTLLVYVNDGGSHNNVSNWIWQIVHDTAGKQYIRNKANGGSWGNWREILTLSGNTITREVTFSQNIRIASDLLVEKAGYKGTIIHTKDGDANGMFAGFGAGGLTCVGSGESVRQIKDNVAATTELLYASSDIDIILASNIQNGWGARKELKYDRYGQLFNQSIEIGTLPNPNYVKNSTFINGLTGWETKAGTLNWVTASYPRVGTAVRVNASAGLSYIDARTAAQNFSQGNVIYFSGWTYTSGLTTGNVAIELVDASTHGLVSSVNCGGNHGWEWRGHSFSIAKSGNYYLRLVASGTNATCYFAKLKMEMQCHSQWVENEYDRIGGGDVMGKKFSIHGMAVGSFNAGQTKTFLDLSAIGANNMLRIYSGVVDNKNGFNIKITIDGTIIYNGVLINLFLDNQPYDISFNSSIKIEGVCTGTSGTYAEPFSRALVWRYY